MRVGWKCNCRHVCQTAVKVVDEAIILDYHIIGLLSEHMAGRAVGMKYSGVVPYGRKSTAGRYFEKPV